MVNSYKAILFDFDFTLGDSSRGICEAFNYALVGVGREPAEDPAIHSLIGHTLQNMFTEVTGSDDATIYQKFRSLFNERAAEVVTPSTIIYAGVSELLLSLRSQNKQLGIISTKYRSRLEEILLKHQLRDHFTVVIGGEDVTNHKPHPEGLHLAIEQLSIRPHEALYVGDTILDAEAAQAAGVAFAAVLTGPTPPETFIPFAPVGIFEDISGLL
jgi:phosphoglycolate phosphatase